MKMPTQSRGSKALVFLVIASMVFMQGMPAGWAGDPVNPNAPVGNGTNSTTPTEAFNPDETLPETPQAPVPSGSIAPDSTGISKTGEGVKTSAGETAEGDDESYEELAQMFEVAEKLIEEKNTRNAVQVKDVEELKTLQSDLKAGIESLPENERADWIKKFNDFLAQKDTIETKPLLVVLEDGKEILLRNTAEVLNEMTRRLNRMDQRDGTVDYTRLAGVRPEHVANVEKMVDYVNARTIGSVVDIPLFDVFSPDGIVQFFDNLVRVYPVSKTEGLLQILDIPEFLRYIDGTKPIYDAAMSAARQIFASHSVSVPSDPLTMDTIKKSLAEIEALNKDLVEAVEEVLKDYTGEQVFKDLVRQQIASEINYGNQSQNYAAIWSKITQAVYNNGIVYNIRGKEIKVSVEELRNFVNYLPYDSSNLFRYPGVKAEVDPAFLNNVITADDYGRLSYVNLFQSGITPSQNVTGSGIVLSNISFSHPGQLQVLEAMLNTWADQVIGNDGKVNFDKLRFRMLISYELEKELGKAEEYLKNQTRKMLDYGNRKTFTAADYAEMKDLLKKTVEELRTRFKPLLENVIYDTTNEVTIRIQDRFRAVVDAFNGVLNQANVTVKLASGEALVVDPRNLQKDVLDKILDAISFRNNSYNGFHRDAYARLSGVSQSLLDGLLSPYSLSGLTTFQFYDWGAYREDFFADKEIQFGLIPRILELHGTADSAELIKKLTQNVVLPVPIGQSLETTIKGTVQELSRTAYDKVAAMNVSTADDMTALQDVLRRFTSGLRTELAKVTSALSPFEISQIEGWVNWDWNVGMNLREVGQLFDQKISQINTLTVGGVKVAVQEILAIAGFPWSKKFDQELFPQLMETDVASAETYSEWSAYRYFRLNGSAPYADDSLSQIGRIQLVVHIVARLLAQVPPPAITFTRSDGSKQVDTESLRVLIKGVREMQAAVIAEAQTRVAQAAEELEQMKKDSYTIEEINTLHEKVIKLHDELTALLETKAGKHERRDVMEVEDDVSLAYQEAHKLFVAMVKAADLTVPAGDQLIIIPAKDIADALIGYLKEQAGENVAAHDFARFYGVGIGVIRDKIHKLENDMGEQIVVMARNSEYVQIVSQISWLGYLQLAAYLVSQYGAEVITDGQVDIAKLMELVTSKERAVARVKQDAQDDTDARIAELEKFASHPLSLDDIHQMYQILEDSKIRLVSMMNDFLSGKGDQALLEELQIFINQLDRSVRMAIDRAWQNNHFEYALDGQKISVALSPELMDRFIQYIEDYIKEHPQMGKTEEPVVSGGIEGGLVLRSDINQDGLVSSGDLTILPLGGIAEKRPMDGMYCPIPWPVFIPDNHPTVFGMLQIFSRLVVKYGEFATVKDAQGGLAFSPDEFFLQMTKPDSWRAEKRLEVLLAKKISEMKTLIDSRRDDSGALKIEMIDEITEAFMAVKAKVRDLGNDAQNKAQEVWAEFMKLYEEAILKGTLSLALGDTRVVFDAATLDELFMKAYQEGSLDQAVMEKLDALIKKGENEGDYSAFKNLWFFRYMIGYDAMNYAAGKGSSFSALDEKDPDISSAAGDFTLQSLVNWFSGVTRKDLSGVAIDVAEKFFLRLTPLDPLKLLGLLNIRTLAPGSGVTVNTLRSAGSMMAMDATVEASYGTDKYSAAENPDLAWKSNRFRVTKLIPASIEVIAESFGIDAVTNGGKIVAEKYLQAMTGMLHVRDKFIRYAADFIKKWFPEMEEKDLTLLKLSKTKLSDKPFTVEFALTNNMMLSFNAVRDTASANTQDIKVEATEATLTAVLQQNQAQVIERKALNDGMTELVMEKRTGQDGAQYLYAKLIRDNSVMQMYDASAKEFRAAEFTYVSVKPYMRDGFVLTLVDGSQLTLRGLANGLTFTLVRDLADGVRKTTQYDIEGKNKDSRFLLTSEIWSKTEKFKVGKVWYLITNIVQSLRYSWASGKDGKKTLKYIDGIRKTYVKDSKGNVTCNSNYQYRETVGRETNPILLQLPGGSSANAKFVKDPKTGLITGIAGTMSQKKVNSNLIKNYAVSISLRNDESQIRYS